MENMEKKDAGMPAGKKKRKIPWSMLYILATVVAVLLFGLFNQQFGNVFHTISNLTPGFLSLGVLISLVYFLFEGEIFRLLLRSQGYRISVVEGLKNALLGLYYSYITPSSTGGQPMQSAYLLRDNKIPAGISTAVLIVKFMCFQCAFVLVSVVSFIGMYGNLAANNPTIAGVRVLHAHARGLWRPGDWLLLLLPQLLCQRRPLRRGDGLAVLHLLPGGHRRGHPGCGGPGLVPQEKAERGPFHQRTS